MNAFQWQRVRDGKIIAGPLGISKLASFRCLDYYVLTNWSQTGELMTSNFHLVVRSMKYACLFAMLTIATVSSAAMSNAMADGPADNLAKKRSGLYRHRAATNCSNPMC